MNTKPFILLQGPVSTRSGYGNHTRDLATALIKSNKYDLQIISLPWGNTPKNALESNNPDHVEINKCITRQNITRQPDVFIQVSVPNEFQPVGKFNIGVTAGIETTVIPHEFLIGANKMNLLIVTSEHSKKGFTESVFDEIDKATNQKKGELRCTTPIEVLFEGTDLNMYKKTDVISPVIKEQMSEVKDDFNFLFVGHWLKGDNGHDRKDIFMMIRTICEAFKHKAPKNRPGVILKTSHATFSIKDRDSIISKIQNAIAPFGNNVPNIYLLHGDLSDTEMNELYNHPKVKAMISFTHGEGFGRPLLEFGVTGKPIIASDWSGHVDFLNKEFNTLLPGQLTNVHPSSTDKFILNGSQWFTVDYGYAAKVLQNVVDDYKKYLEKSRKQTQYIKNNFSLEKMSELFCKYVDNGLNSTPKQVSLNLPKLQKISDQQMEIPKLQLPKLQKIK